MAKCNLEKLKQCHFCSFSIQIQKKTKNAKNDLLEPEHHLNLLPMLPFQICFNSFHLAEHINIEYFSYTYSP